jgi:hypothetical protein
MAGIFVKVKPCTMEVSQSWVIFLPPNRKETPLKIRAMAKAIAGIPQPAANAPNMTRHRCQLKVIALCEEASA